MTYLRTVEAAAVLGIHRDTLDAMVDRAPKDLPGGPVHVGAGRLRRHLRWNAATLDEWLRAYRAWEATRSGLVRRPRTPEEVVEEE